jgi:hypothetical protein
MLRIASNGVLIDLTGLLHKPRLMTGRNSFHITFSRKLGFEKK